MTSKLLQNQELKWAYGELRTPAFSFPSRVKRPLRPRLSQSYLLSRTLPRHALGRQRFIIMSCENVSTANNASKDRILLNPHLCHRWGVLDQSTTLDRPPPIFLPVPLRITLTPFPVVSIPDAPDLRWGSETGEELLLPVLPEQLDRAKAWHVWRGVRISSHPWRCICLLDLLLKHNQGGEPESTHVPLTRLFPCSRHYRTSSLPAGARTLQMNSL